MGEEVGEAFEVDACVRLEQRLADRGEIVCIPAAFLDGFNHVLVVVQYLGSCRRDAAAVDPVVVDADAIVDVLDLQDG